MKRFAVAMMAAALVVLGFSTARAATVKKLCLPHVESDGARCDYFKTQWYSTLGKRYITRQLNEPQFLLYPRGKKQSKANIANIKAMNKAAQEKGCSAYVLYYCNKAKWKYKGKSYKGHAVAIGVLLAKGSGVGARLYKRKRYFTKDRTIERLYESVAKRRNISKALTVRGTICNTDADCNSGAKLLKVCKSNACVENRCSSDSECKAGFYCDGSVPNTCVKAQTAGKACTRARQCAAGWCDTNKGTCPGVVSMQTPVNPTAGNVIQLQASCDPKAANPCGGFYTCDSLLKVCRLMRGKACSKTSQCASADYCGENQSRQLVCLERQGEGKACSQYVLCKQGLACASGWCRKPSASQKNKPTVYEGNWKHVSFSFSVGGGGLIDLQNPLRESGFGTIRLALHKRKGWFGGFIEASPGSSRFIGGFHFSFFAGLSLKLVDPDVGDGHGLYLDAGFQYWLRGNLPRYGATGMLRYALPLWIFNRSWSRHHKLLFSIGAGGALRVRGPFSEEVLPHLTFSAAYAYIF